MGKIVETPFHLTNSEAGITEADGTASTWSDIWKYQVPPGMGIKLTSSDQISVYLEDSAPAEVGSSTCRVRVQVRNAAETDNDGVYGPSLYLLSKEFQERPKVARLSVGERIVSAREFIVLQAYDDGTIDASDSYFDILTTRIFQTLGE